VILTWSEAGLPHPEATSSPAAATADHRRMSPP
jgi:hypothetical protein